MSGFFVPNGCDTCGNTSIVQEFLDAFGVRVCYGCRGEEKLISKSKAQQVFLLTDGDLKGLGTVERKNPLNKNYKPMRMYLESQVEEVAVGKHGSLAAITERRQRQATDKITLRIKRKADEEDRGDRDKEQLEKIQKQIQDEARSRMDRAVEDIRDKKTGKVRRKIEGGPTVDVEEL